MHLYYIFGLYIPKKGGRKTMMHFITFLRMFILVHLRTRFKKKIAQWAFVKR